MERCERLRVDLIRPDRAVVNQAARVIRTGGVAAVPTDTLYGLAADPFNEAAVRKLFRIKRRPESMPILLFVDSLQRMEALVEQPPASFHWLAERFWPGPLTMILPARPEVPELVTAGSGTVAVRLPHSVLLRSLVRLCRRPLTGTSANISGRAGGGSARAVARQLGARLDLLVDAGPAKRSIPSTIVDLCGEAPRVVRSGAIPSDVILHAIGRGNESRSA